MGIEIRPRRVYTTANLGNAEVFLSDAVNGEKYGRFTGKVASDQGGTLVFEHADDDGTGEPPSTGWDQLTSITVMGGTSSKFDEILYCKWIRVRYTNGASPTTSFRLSGYLGPRG